MNSNYGEEIDIIVSSGVIEKVPIERCHRIRWVVLGWLGLILQRYG
jgi:desulfoferrodoxin (superoxide reductase-like protein)